MRSQKMGSQAETIRIVRGLINRNSFEYHYCSTAGNIGTWRSTGRIPNTARTSGTPVDQWADWGFGWFGWIGELGFRHIVLQHGRVDSQHNDKYGTVIRGVWRTLSQQQRSAYTAPMPVPAGSVHAHTQTKPSRAGAVVSPKISNDYCTCFLRST